MKRKIIRSIGLLMSLFAVGFTLVSCGDSEVDNTNTNTNNTNNTSTNNNNNNSNTNNNNTNNTSTNNNNNNSNTNNNNTNNTNPKVDTEKTYTITWKNADGNVLETDTNVKKGATPSYDGNTPTKESDVRYNYTFSGWSPELKSVDGDTTYTALYNSEEIKYNVTFKDEDGTILKEATEYEYGTSANDIVKPADPTKAATPEFTYTFDGWDKEIAEVREDATYTATYSEAKNQYTYNFVIEGVDNKTTADYGTQIVVPSNPTKASTPEFTYTFDGWYIGNEKVISFGTLTGDVTYEARFKETKNQYTYNFVIEGVDNKTTADYGTQIVAPSNPIKSSTAEYRYTFDGWYIGNDKVTSFGTLTSNVTYEARFNPVKNKYTVTFNSNGGSSVSSKELEWGILIDKPTNPTRSGYEFAGWLYNDVLWDFSKDKMPICDIELKASWNRLATITYYAHNLDGTTSLIDTKTVYYNDGFQSLKFDLDSKYTKSSWYDEDKNVYSDKTPLDSDKLAVYTDIYTKQLVIKVSNNIAYVDGYHGSDSNIEIPLLYLGYPVTLIGYRAFAYDYNIVNVKLTKNIKEIEKEAFYQCSNLTTVSNTAYIGTLGDYCFEDTKIKSFDGSSLTNMGKGCFWDCTDFEGFNKLTAALTIIPERAFKGCTKLTSFDFKNSIKEIGEYAFSCSGISSLSNYSNLELIGAYAFETSSLTSFDANSNLKIIEDYAFIKCSSLTSFTLSSSVKYVGCKILEGSPVTYNIKNNNKYIGTSNNSYYLLYEAEVASTVTILSDCNVIAGDSCRGLTSLKSVSIPDSVKGIGKNAFAGCSKLTKVTISESSNLKIIGMSAFASCNIGKIVLPYYIEYIGLAAFSNNDNLTIDSKREGFYYKYDSDVEDDWTPVLSYVDITEYNTISVSSSDFKNMLTSAHYLFVWSDLTYNHN